MVTKAIAEDKSKGGEQSSEIGIHIGKAELEFVNDIDQKVQLAYDSTSKRRQRNDKFYRKRFQMTGGTKTYPWVGASNIPIPFVDEIITKLKGKYMGHMWGNNILANFEPGNPTENNDERIEKIEAWFDYLVKRRMRPYRESEIMIDSMLQKGKSYVKCIYEKKVETVCLTYNYDEFPPEIKKRILENKGTILGKKKAVIKAQFRCSDEITEKILDKIIAGERGKITIKVKEHTIYDAPKWIVKEEEDIVVPYGTTNIQDAAWICDKNIWLTERQLLSRADSGKYNKTAVEKIIAEKKTSNKSTESDRPLEDTSKDVREGVSGSVGDDQELYHLYEVCCYYDLDGDGRNEKALLTYCHDSPDHPLRFGYFPYEVWPLNWNYVEFSNEHTSDSIHSPRGIAEKLDAIQTEIQVQHNQKIDHQTIVNAPMFKVKRGGGTVPGSVRFTPGEQVLVDDMNDWTPVFQPNREMSYEREEMSLRRMGESLTGIYDSTLMGNQNTSSRRTAREITKLDTSENQQFGADAMRFQNSLVDLYYLTYALWVQWGPTEMFVRWGGEDGQAQGMGGGQGIGAGQGQQTPEQAAQSFSRIKSDKSGSGRAGAIITKRDIVGMWDIVPSTDLSKSSYSEKQEAIYLYQMLAGNPMIDQRKLLRRVISKINFQLVNDLLKSVEQIQKEQQAPQYDAQDQGAQKQRAGGAMQTSPMETNLGG